MKSWGDTEKEWERVHEVGDKLTRTFGRMPCYECLGRGWTRILRDDRGHLIMCARCLGRKVEDQ